MVYKKRHIQRWGIRVSRKNKRKFTRKSIKSLEKSREINYDPWWEYSKYAQNEGEEYQDELEKYNKSPLEEKIEDNWRLRELSSSETSDDDRESVTSETSSQRRTREAERSIKRSYYSNRSSKYETKNKGKKKVREILESLIAIVEKEDNDSSIEDSFWDYKVPNRS